MRLFPPAIAAAFCAAVSVSASEIDATGLYDLPSADVYLLGEVHDNPVHHAHQAIAVGAIGAKALVFEMLTDDQARAATPEARSSSEALERALSWDSDGWPTFADYYPIFTAAPDAVIYGGAVPRDSVRQAVQIGAAEVFGAGAPLFGLDQPLSEAEQTLREAEQMTNHCDALPVEMLGGMVEAQRLRDAALSRAVVAAVAETGGPVAVITGNGHARNDRAITRALSVASPDLDVLSMGQLETPQDDPPFDLWLITDPAPRGDPCAAFR